MGFIKHIIIFIIIIIIQEPTDSNRALAYELTVTQNKNDMIYYN